MQGIGTVAIDGPWFEEFLRSRKDFAVGLHSWVNLFFSKNNQIKEINLRFPQYPISYQFIYIIINDNLAKPQSI